MVRGRVVAADNNDPLRFGHIYIGKERVGTTGYKGGFTLHIAQDTARLVVNFVDPTEKFIDTPKVFIFDKRGGSIYHDVKGKWRVCTRGTVKASVTFIDPRNITTAAAAPGDLNFVDGEGDMLPLRTYGMFSVDFRDESNKEALGAGAVQVLLDTQHVKMEEHIPAMKLWSLNPETGVWEEESDFSYTRATGSHGRTKREERTEQVEGVVINLINLEPQPGFSSNPRGMGPLRQGPDAYTAYVTAIMGGEELEAAPSSPKMNPNIIGVSQPYLDKIDYQRSDHNDPALQENSFQNQPGKPNQTTLTKPMARYILIGI
ncbi:hypothetical protein CRUP_015118 [Coryphaenoides rupestris]|nr:hypothetical protein CRUP_015118 [Coryphaenoides rupestris]